MIVCLCKGVSCGTIRQSIQEGASSVAEIARACGAGTDCGGCETMLEELLEEEMSAGRRLPIIRAA